MNIAIEDKLRRAISFLLFCGITNPTKSHSFSPTRENTLASDEEHRDGHTYRQKIINFSDLSENSDRDDEKVETDRA